MQRDPLGAIWLRKKEFSEQRADNGESQTLLETYHNLLIHQSPHHQRQWLKQQLGATLTVAIP